ncbi:hypothetical protein G9A89_003690 [Geosiphon pyriformis]|nr:hypothetical protein G9A89_003690 [Geosiphon pyriformis]
MIQPINCNGVSGSKAGWRRLIVAHFRAMVCRHHMPQLPQLIVTTGVHNSTGLSKIPDRDTILNSSTAVRDPDRLVVGTGTSFAIMANQLNFR